MILSPSLRDTHTFISFNLMNASYKSKMQTSTQPMNELKLARRPNITQNTHL